MSQIDFNENIKQINEKNFSKEIDDLDRKVLFELDKNCRISTSELGELLNKSRQTIEYRIKRLQESGVLLGFNAVFNSSKMGLNLYKFQLKIRNFEEDKASLLKHLRNLGKVYWIGQSSGSWDIIFSVLYKDKSELKKIMNDLMLNFQRVIVKLHGHEIYEIHQFPKMYLTRNLEKVKEHTSAKIENVTLDTQDYKIIGALVKNARIPIKQLAKKLDLNPNSVKRKIQNLEDTGVIVQYRIGVNHKKLGYDFYKTYFNLKSYTEEEYQQYVTYISKFPEVQFYLRNFWSVEIELISPTFEYYQSIIDDIKRAFPRMLGEHDTLLLSTDEWNSAFTDYLE